MTKDVHNDVCASCFCLYNAAFSFNTTSGASSSAFLLFCFSNQYNAWQTSDINILFLNRYPGSGNSKTQMAVDYSSLQKASCQMGNLPYIDRRCRGSSKKRWRYDFKLHVTSYIVTVFLESKVITEKLSHCHFRKWYWIKIKEDICPVVSLCRLDTRKSNCTKN